MRVIERLGGATPSASPSTRGQPADLEQVVARIHDRVVDRIDLSQVARLEPAALFARLRAVVQELAAEEHIPLAEAERDAVAQKLVDEMTGLGPIEGLLADPQVSDVLVNTPAQVWIERDGRLELTAVRFRDQAHLVHTIRRIAAHVGRRIDESSPMVDARLPDGSRVNAVLPPLAIDGPLLSIRRFGSRPLTADELYAGGSLDREMLAYLAAAVRARLTILVAGGTGAGKTTLLNVLSSFIPDRERILTIEDAAELRLQQRHVCRLETRPPNLEGKGEVTIRDLVRNALRMRPDRIVVGEVRGNEVLDMLQAMNTGHEGSLATLHANSPVDAIGRLMTMLGMSGIALSEAVMARLIARAVQVIVHVQRDADGQRRVTSIAEVAGQAGPVVELEEIFAWAHSPAAARGGFVHVRPTRFAERLLRRERAR